MATIKCVVVFMNVGRDFQVNIGWLLNRARRRFYIPWFGRILSSRLFLIRNGRSVVIGLTLIFKTRGTCWCDPVCDSTIWTTWRIGYNSTIGFNGSFENNFSIWSLGSKNTSKILGKFRFYPAYLDVRVICQPFDHPPIGINQLTIRRLGSIIDFQRKASLLRETSNYLTVGSFNPHISSRIGFLDNWTMRWRRRRRCISRWYWWRRDSLTTISSFTKEDSTIDHSIWGLDVNIRSILWCIWTFLRAGRNFG